MPAIRSNWLPRGRVLPADTWERRHAVLVWLLWAHIVVLPGYGVIQRDDARHIAGAVAVLVLTAALASRRSLSITARSIACSVGLILCSAMVVHLSGGASEAHLHFFVVVPLVGVYQQWRPFVIAIAVVFAHDLVLSTFRPHLIYAHTSALSPVARAFIQLGFVLGAAVGVMFGWRHSERENDQAREVLEGLSRYGDVLLQSAGEGIVAVDAEGLCTFVNPTAAATLGYTVDALVGRSLHEMIHSRRADGSAYPERDSASFRVVASGVAERVDHDYFWRADGTRLPVQYTCSPIGDGQRINGATIVFHDISAEHETEQTLRAGAAELSQAIAAGQLVLHYQPKVELTTGHTYAVEALVRWQHPTRGLVFPDEFIPLAEATGIIGALTLWVTESAIEQQASWRAAGISVSVAINLAPQSLTDGMLYDAIVLSLAKHGVPARSLELELTETAVMRDPTSAISAMNRYAELGVGMAIDDFGTGFSTLTYLRLMPADTIKVDRSFVMTMTSDERNAIIVRSTIELAHELGKRVVAEGVENEEIHQALMRLGCDVGQGYHWSRPLPANELVAWLSLPAVPADAVMLGLAAAAGASRTRPEVAVATRSLIWAREESQIFETIATLVRSIGGTIEDRSTAGPDAMSFDLSLGRSGCLVAVAPRGSLARNRLEHVLPDFLATSREALWRLGQSVLNAGSLDSGSLDSILLRTDAIVALVDDAFLLCALNPAGAEAANATADWLVGQPADALVVPRDAPDFRRSLRMVARTGVPETLEVELACPTSDVRRSIVWSISVVAHEPTVLACIGIDVSATRSEVEVLRGRAVTDELTGLPNRAGLLEHLASMRGSGASVVFCDLNGFKAVNDTFGHASGDAVLVQVARRLSKTVRGDDFVARLGGDEFVIVVPPDDDSDFDVFARRLMRAMTQPIMLPGAAVATVGMSIGVAILEVGQEPSSVLIAADHEMYLMKSRQPTRATR